MPSKFGDARGFWEMVTRFDSNHRDPTAEAMGRRLLLSLYDSVD